MAGDLSELTAADIAALTADPLNTRNPLLPYSLRGQSERFRKMAVEARPLLGEVCLRGQVTLCCRWPPPPDRSAAAFHDFRFAPDPPAPGLP